MSYEITVPVKIRLDFEKPVAPKAAKEAASEGFPVDAATLKRVHEQAAQEWAATDCAIFL